LTQDLLAWKQDKKRKPLILHGARQVGKTYLVEQFARDHYENLAYFDLERQTEVAALFEGDLDPARIIRLLSTQMTGTIEPEKTLVVFDEVQACKRALTSLKYFQQQAPQYHVIAAGSLLGVALGSSDASFPVGKVDFLSLYPMDFEEYLMAQGKEDLANLIKECAHSLEAFPFHESALELYDTYCMVGGMPEAVADYRDTNDFVAVKKIHQTIETSYVADMQRYASPYESVRIAETWRSIPAQLAKENHKFIYTAIRSGARGHTYETALAWLELARIVNRCTQVSLPVAPLSLSANESMFKLYLADTGMLNTLFTARSAGLMPSSSALSPNFRGALVENYVMQQLTAQGAKPHYWGSFGKAEVDFLIEREDGTIIPIEAKSSVNVKAKSLALYVEKYSPPYAVRVSRKNFGTSNNIKSLPLYAAFCL
jgi:predicted AAA+ superfamily ATPase